MPMIIGALISALISALRTYLPGIVGRVLIALGIGIATETIAMPALKGFIQSKLGGLPSVLVAYWDATGIGIMVTMILSAMLANRAQRAFLSKLGG